MGVLRLLRQQVFGVLALLVALVGTSYAVASGTVGSKQITDNSIRSKDVRDKSLLAKDFKPGQLPAGAAGPAGPAGPAGAPGTARAYGTVRPDECFSTTAPCTIYRDKGIAKVTRPLTGTYCVTPAAGVSFADVTPALTTDSYNGGPTNGSGTSIVSYSSLGSSCLATEIEVRTYRATGAGATIGLSNSTSFAIVVP